MQLDYRSMPLMQQYILDSTRYTLFSGGFGNGKSYGLCVKMMSFIMKYPGTRIAMIRSTVPQLTSTLIPIFFEIIDTNPEECKKHPHVEYWNAQKRFLRFKNGSEVYFLYADGDNAIKNLRSHNLHGIGIDEAAEINEVFWAECTGRLRGTDAPCFMTGVTNPKSKGHFLYKKFYVKGKHKAEYVHYDAPTDSNPHLPEEFVKSLKEDHDEQWLKRYFHGSWDVFSGQIYEEYDQNIHVIDEIEIPENWKIGCGLDSGYTNPTVVLWFAIDNDGNVIVYDELVRTKRTAYKVSKDLKELKGVTSKTLIYADPSTKQTETTSGQNVEGEYANNGVYLTMANNKVRPGIERVKDFLRVDSSKPHPFKSGVMGASKLYITKNCRRLINELPQYEWKQLSPRQLGLKNQDEVPNKVDDHAVDALRYFIFTHWGVYTPTKEPEPERRFEEVDIEAEIKQHRKNMFKQKLDWRSY